MSVKIVITDGCVGNFICDGYEDGSRRHILGCIVKTLSKWISYDKGLGDKGRNIIAQHEHHGIVTAILIEQAVERTSCNLGIPLNSIVTASVSAHNTYYHCAFPINILANAMCIRSI
jgi:hypothetical protein